MTSPAEPRLPRVIRASLPRAARRQALVLGLLWAGIGATVGALLGAFIPSAHPFLLFGCAAAAGLPLAARRVGWGLLAALALFALGMAISVARWSPFLIAGSALGVLLVLLRQGPGFAVTLQGALAGATLSTVAAALSARLLEVGLPATLTGGLQGALVGISFAPLLWLASVEWKSAVRAPPPRIIQATLPAEHREPCVKAWELDQALAAQTSETETRDGLGEVAAWVYRLSWSQAALSRELQNIDAERLEGRLSEARKAAAEAGDALTREPREATVRHLEQLSSHRDALILEQQRTGALIDYALAFLEQARAGLALARVRPGEGMPERLGDVLTRLRSQTAEGDARRQTARQLTPLA